VVQPALPRALDLHAIDLVLVPPEHAAQLDRRQELVVGVHPHRPVGTATVDLVDERVACLAEIPQLPVAVLVPARRAGVRLRVHRLADRRRRDLERAVGRAGVDQHDAVDDVLDRLEATRQVALLVLDDHAGQHQRLARERSQHDVALSRAVERIRELDREQVGGLHAKLEQAGERVHERRDCRNARAA
jgi:hypothetical protein